MGKAKSAPTYYRPRISALLDEASRRGPLILTVTPSGYGKTMAVRDYLDSLRHADSGGHGKKNRVAWATLTEMDNHPARFWRTVQFALETTGLDASDIHVVPGVGPEELRHAFSALITRACAESKLTLVLDNLYLLESPALLRCVDEIARQNLPGLKLFLLSRTVPPFLTANPEAYAYIKPVEVSDLAFTQDETRTWLASQGMEVTEARIALLMEQTGGRISDLHIRAIDVPDTPKTPEALGKIIERKFLALYDEGVRDFLLRVSCLNEHPVALCAYTAFPETSGTAAARRAEHIFTHATTGNPFLWSEGRGRWHIHPIFLSFLRKRAAEQAPEFFRNCLDRAAAWYESQGAPYDAAACHVRSGNHTALADLLARVGLAAGMVVQDLDDFVRDEFMLRRRLIEALPIALLRDRAPMLELAYLLFLIVLHDVKAIAAKVAEIRAHYGPQPPSEVRNRILGETEIVATTTTHRDLSAKAAAFERAYELLGGPSIFSRSPVPLLFGSPSVLMLYYNDARPMDAVVGDYCAHWRRFRPLLGDMFDGMSEAIRGEAAYERGLFDEAAALAANIDTGRQQGTEMAAIFLRARLAAATGDASELEAQRGKMKRLAAECNRKSFYLTYDLAATHFAALLADSALLPKWLSEERPWEARSLAETVGLRMELMAAAFWFSTFLAPGTRGAERTENSSRLTIALPLLRGSLAHSGSQLGLLRAQIYEAALHHAEGRAAKARRTLHAAYKMASPEGLVMPFVERSLALHPLVQTLLRPGQRIKDEAFRAWLSDLDARMRAWSKTRRRLRQRFAILRTEGANLSPREAEVHEMTSRNLSGEEIAAALGITRENLRRIRTRIADKKREL